jgi:hypothetical protein
MPCTYRNRIPRSDHTAELAEDEEEEERVSHIRHATRTGIPTVQARLKRMRKAWLSSFIPDSILIHLFPYPWTYLGRAAYSTQESVHKLKLMSVTSLNLRQYFIR